MNTKYLILFFSGLLFILFCGLVSAYPTATAGVQYTIGEFVFDNDYNPITVPCCNISIYYPDDTPYVENVLMSNVGNWHFYNVTLTSPLGLYHALMSCDYAGDYGAIDKSFILGSQGLQLINPNPADGSTVISSVLGQTTCIDVECQNFLNTVYEKTDNFELYNGAPGVTGNSRASEKIIVQNRTMVYAIGLRLYRTGSGYDPNDTFEVALQKSDGLGNPDGINLTIGSYSFDALPTTEATAQWFNITLNQPYLVEVGDSVHVVVTDYDLVPTAAVEAMGYLYSDFYPYGWAYYDIGYGWMNISNSELCFRLYGYNLTWENVANVTFSDNVSGSWIDRYTAYLVGNGTVCYLNTNMIFPGMTYYWNVSANIGSDWVNKSYHFSTEAKAITISNPNPANESTGILFNRLTGVTTSAKIDYNAFGTLDVILSSNSSGSWIPYYTTSLSSESYIYKQNINFSRPGQTYYWSITATDSFDPSITETVIYHFTNVVRPYGSVRVYGTEYSPGEPGTVYSQILYDDGTPSNISSPTLTIWEKNSKYIDTASMTYITGSNGCYLYNFVVPLNISVFLADVQSDTPSAYGSGEFHVSEWSSVIPHINDTVNDINITVHQMYQIISYVNNTYLPLIETDINSLYSLCNGMNTNVSIISVNWDTLYGYVWEIYNVSLYLNGTIWGDTAIPGMMDILHYINDTRFDGYNLSDIYNIVDNIENVVLTINTTTSSVLTSKLDDLSILCNNINDNLTGVSVDVDSIYSLVYDSYNISLYLNSSWSGGSLSVDILNVLNYINDTRWDGLNASDIYTISNDIKNIVSIIDATTSSLGNNFEVRLTDFGEVAPGKNYLAQITVFGSNGTMEDADSSPQISLYDANGNLIVFNAAMTWTSTGQYTYSYTTSSGQTSGQWTSIVKTRVGGIWVKNIEYWELEANPPEVTISITDNCIPTIDGLITITNEGTSEQEYIYYYWITPRADGDYLDGDTIDSGSSSKLVAAFNTFTTIKTLVVPNPGTYWYKVRVYYGTEWSAASAQFTAVQCGVPSGGGVTPPAEKRYKLTVTTVGKDLSPVSCVKIDIYDGIRLLETKFTNNTGFATFTIANNMMVRIVASKQGYQSAEKTIQITKATTEQIQMNKIAGAELSWLWILLIIIGGVTIYILYKRQRSSSKHF